jgi:hypothetical protein
MFMPFSRKIYRSPDELVDFVEHGSLDEGASLDVDPRNLK